MDEPVFMDLWQVEEQRQGREQEDTSDDMMSGLRMGLRGAKNISGLVDGMKKAIENRRGKVMHVIARDKALSPFIGQVDAIARQMKPGWWTARAKNSPEEIAHELAGYAMERLRRAEAKRRREAAGVHREPVPRETRPAPEEIKKAGWLTVQPDEPVQRAVDRAVEYYAYPDRMPKREFPPVKIKDWSSLSTSTVGEYKKNLIQTQRELREAGARTPWDMVAYLADKSRQVSRSKYNMHRACIVQAAAARGDDRLIGIIRSMPPYNELCGLVGATPTPRSGEITQARRRKKNEKEWGNLLSACSARHRDIFKLIRTVGCRVGEAPSIRLKRDDDGGITVSIQTSKVGSRHRKNLPATRVITFQTGTPEHDLLSGLLGKRGAAPVDGMTVDSIRAAWTRARQKCDLMGDQAWCLHALRHAYADRRKKEIDKEYSEQYGGDWRRKLYGPGWCTETEINKKYMKEVYGELAYEMGHSSEEMTKLYG